MFSPKPDRPYFEAWLRRTGKQFAASGRLSQTAMLLAAGDGGSMEEWRSRLRTLMQGNEIPSIELLTRIDKLLAAPARKSPNDSLQGTLF